ncbi:GNAT family N-acetyltransferase [Salinibius halmophilus]|uniref:GNAT family N-acetyltransferase n=1 Tax=Salinibius halmophilus TaxID=1853216 RepID=UPI000E66BF47|nr:GNAT family N-acetyltransferase [Salinibius halmophilus]
MLQTTRTTMRPIIEDDWPFYLALTTNPAVMRFVGDIQTREDIRQRFESSLPAWSPEADHWLMLAIINTETDAIIGVTGGQARKLAGEFTVEVGFLIDPSASGYGYASESLFALRKWLFSHEAITGLTATVTEGNEASVRVLEKCGFYQTERVADNYQIAGQQYADLIFTCKS